MDHENDILLLSYKQSNQAFRQVFCLRLSIVKYCLDSIFIRVVAFCTYFEQKSHIYARCALGNFVPRRMCFFFFYRIQICHGQEKKTYTHNQIWNFIGRKKPCGSMWSKWLNSQQLGDIAFTNHKSDTTVWYCIILVV